MGTTINQQAYQRLISEDLEYIRKQPRTIERDHIEQILNDSSRVYYDLPSSPEARRDRISRAGGSRDLVHFYSIEGYDSRPGRGMSQSGFSIVLAGELAAEVARFERKPDAPLYTMLEEQIHGSFPESETPLRHFDALDFYGNTWLLLGLKVFGDCACFGVEGASRSALDRGEVTDLRYSPHNIDSPQQAAALLSTWLLWFNHVITLTDFKSPFKV